MNFSFPLYIYRYILSSLFGFLINSNKSVKYSHRNREWQTIQLKSNAISAVFIACFMRFLSCKKRAKSKYSQVCLLAIRTVAQRLNAGKLLFYDSIFLTACY